MKILSVETVAAIVRRHGLENLLKDLMVQLRDDFARWQEFNKIPRPAMQVPGGVLELMPICDKEYYAFKYVNYHPKNPEKKLLTVVATGQLSRVDTGYPILISEMTVLTALRTAATTALATDLLARKNSSTLAIIGTGAQSEFLVTALCLIRDIQEVRYFDVDAQAMEKFRANLAGNGFRLVACPSAERAVAGADIITTCTACKANVDVVKDAWVKPGAHINGIGGDTVGKTELELSLLRRSKIVVEYLEQSRVEGEIQRLGELDIQRQVHGELHELIAGAKPGRQQESEITLYDSVGIGLEDYSALRLIYQLASDYNLGQEVNLVPSLLDPKNLISVLE